MIVKVLFGAIAGLNGLFCMSFFVCAVVMVGVVLSRSPVVIVDTPEDDA
jgi:hypothetical protein